MMSNLRDQSEPFIEGDFYEGAFGPSILLILTSAEAISWLRKLVEDLATGAVGTEVSLVSQPRVQIGAALDDLRLCLVDRKPAKHLVREAYDRFVWRCTSGEWEAIGLMLEPLLDQPGHQYLTLEGVDDALIEVSFGEGHG
jgi:hypothetical protein